MTRAHDVTQIPLARPQLGEEEIAAVAEVIRSHWVSQGQKVAELEERFADYVGARHAVALTSATTALHLALLVSGISSKDDVICPSFSFVATANSIRYVGARPVFVDIDPHTYNLDPSLVEQAITRATKAILVVHQIGLAADLDALNQIAQSHGLVVIEDAACAIGARYRGKLIGAAQNLACFSFHPRKLITTGEGGMVTSHDGQVAAKLRQLRSHGASVSDVARHQAGGILTEVYDVLGYNYRMTDLQAALGLVQIRRLPGILARYAAIANQYTRALGDMQEVEVPYVPEYATHSYQSYLVRFTTRCRTPRDEVLRRMVARGISSRRGISPIHLEPLYASSSVRLPATEEAARATMFLPIFADMTDEQITFVVDSLKASIAQS
jgi:perosamine synthetase